MPSVAEILDAVPASRARMRPEKRDQSAARRAGDLVGVLLEHLIDKFVNTDIRARNPDNDL